MPCWKHPTSAAWLCCCFLRSTAWQSTLEGREADLKQREATLQTQQDAASRSAQQVQQEQQRLAAETKRLQVRMRLSAVLHMPGASMESAQR
jgi:hypothetical protein